MGPFLVMHAVGQAPGGFAFGEALRHGRLPARLQPYICEPQPSIASLTRPVCVVVQL